MILGGDDRKRIQKRIQKTSKKQEQRSANLYRGSRNPMSGAGWVKKNDVRSEDLLIENKFTDNKKSYTIKNVDLVELTQRAVLEDRIPVLQFDLGGRHYVVLNENDFLCLIEEQ